MSRYIDVDETLEQIRKKLGVKSLSYLLEVERQIVVVIQSMSSIDIVRCKECRWGKPYSEKQLECDALGLGGLKFPNDFCSYGERIEP